MKRVVGNHVGIVVNVSDPENRGRVQVFVPHISTTLYNNWNEKLKDIKFKTFEDSVFDSATKERLLSLLPWAEAAVPVWGGGTGAPVNTNTGTPIPFPTDQAFSYNSDPNILKNGLFQSSNGTPWSGGFISSIANSSGSNFPSNLAHAGYVDAISSGNNPNWQKLDPTTAPKIGDIVVGSRTGGSHGDIVTNVGSDGTLTVIGGNVGNTVSQYNKKISSNDYAIIRATSDSVASNMASNATNEYNLWSSNGWNEKSPDALGRLSQYYGLQPVSTSSKGPSASISGEVDPRKIEVDGLARADGSYTGETINYGSTEIGDTNAMSPAFKSQYERVLNNLTGSKFDPASNGGKKIIPDDGKTYGITTGSKEEWANLFTRLASVESSFTPNVEADIMGIKPGQAGYNGTSTSYGIYQLGKERIKSGENAFDANDNTKAFVRTAEDLYFGKTYGKPGNGVIGGTGNNASGSRGNYYGLAAAFGPIAAITNGTEDKNQKGLLAENILASQKATGNYTGGSSGNKIFRTTDMGMATGSYNAGRIGGPSGMFSCPAVGAKVWVFFQAENPQRPVYFANVYEPSNANAAGVPS